MTNLTPRQSALRALIEGTARFEIVQEATNPIVDRALDLLNEHLLRGDDQMIYRALVARAIIGTAAEWLGDMTKMPKPDCYAVLWDLAQNPPADFIGECYVDGKISARNAARDAARAAASASYVSYRDGVGILAAQGFLNHFETGENGDLGPRHYFCRDGAETNEHGRPIVTAQLDNWGDDNWTVTLPADGGQG